MFLIFVCHPCILPLHEILGLLPNSKCTKTISYWNSKTTHFLKYHGVRWSKQLNTLGTALIIEGGDGFSSQGATDLMGMIENEFSRDLVIIVSSVHKLPEHVIQRGTIHYSVESPSLKRGWVDDSPKYSDLDGWSRILRI